MSLWGSMSDGAEIGKFATEIGKTALDGIKEIKPSSFTKNEYPNMFERPDDAGIRPVNIEGEKVEPSSALRTENPAMFERPENTRLQVDAENLKLQRIEVVDGKTHYYDDNGKLYRVNYDLLPNNSYEINGYKYGTDEKGRIKFAEGELHLKNRVGRLPIRDSIEDIGKGDQRETDDRGHLIGDQFDGANGLENIIPQDAEINRNDFRNFENQLADEVKNGKSVRVKIEPIYEGDSRRPSDIVVTYNINGKEDVRIFPNSKEDL